MKELPKQYDAKQYEDSLYLAWEESGLFNPDICVEKGVTKKDAKPFSMVLPPPNVTGTLHMGHAAMLAIEDVLIRYHRMKGDKTLWIPGTDHAAVATESKVEKLLIEKGAKKPKAELGREKFLEHVKKFAQASHDTIVNQSKKMGASLDWSREAYTLDDERNLAVRTVFKKMYDDGLIYRGYRVINWSVKGQSTCSDDELVYVERPGKLYYFKYSKDFPITIATTRPETKLGDTAVAVHPDDKRYQKYIGKTFVVEVGAAKPLNIKIIADVQVEMEKGTGALGVTPAHSVIDFEMYTKQKVAGNDIGLVQVIGEDGKMTAAAGKNYSGLYINKAREKFVEYLRAEGLLEKEEDTMQNVGTSDRFSDVVEPLPKTQWFVDVNKKVLGVGLFVGRFVSLKDMMQEAVRGGHTKIVPERFEKIYFHWIDNLRDWCISRQIWFGHRIPVYYCTQHNPACSEPIVSVQDIAQCPQCKGAVEQDPDSLDTWFSSGLWTFSTLGWPHNTEDLKIYHPTAVLETGYDIIFFWVARMILMSTYTLGDVPFKTVYLHGLVRDDQGRKMSKTLGNIIDPLDMIEKYGTDATRLSLLIGGTAGNDVKLSEEKIAGFRNFTTKLWNIARFMMLNVKEPALAKASAGKQGAENKEQTIPKPKTLADTWILLRLEQIIQEATKGLEKFQFSQVGEMLRDFTWNDLADWYLEIVKVEQGTNDDKTYDKSDILLYILQTMLKLWHPFMPFVTEQIYQQTQNAEHRTQNDFLMVKQWPSVNAKLTASLPEDTIAQFTIIQNIVTAIRSARAEYKIEPAKKVSVVMNAGTHVQMLLDNVEIIVSMARLEDCQIEKKTKKPDGAVTVVESGIEIYIDFSQAIDTEKEQARIEKELAEVEPYIAQLEKKLNNADFISRAKPEIVDAEKKKLAEAIHRRDMLRSGKK